jgi:hypothetical protein
VRQTAGESGLDTVVRYARKTIGAVGACVVDRMTAELPKGTPLVCTSCGLQIQNYSDAIKLMELFDVS